MGHEGALGLLEALLLEEEHGVVGEAAEVDDGVEGRVLAADVVEALAKAPVHHPEVIERLDESRHLPVRRLAPLRLDNPRPRQLMGGVYL
ncbi:MAG: hypothetical protein ABII00_01315 [Elusimicrobiota bacterium]